MNFVALAATDSIADYTFGVVPLFVLMGLAVCAEQLVLGPTVKADNAQCDLCLARDLTNRHRGKSMRGEAPFGSVQNSVLCRLTACKSPVRRRKQIFMFRHLRHLACLRFRSALPSKTKD